jgi:hypothetical protein
MTRQARALELASPIPALLALGLLVFSIILILPR